MLPDIVQMQEPSRLIQMKRVLRPNVLELAQLAMRATVESSNARVAPHASSVSFGRRLVRFNEKRSGYSNLPYLSEILD